MSEKNKKTFITMNQEVHSKFLQLKKESIVMKLISLKKRKVFEILV